MKTHAIIQIECNKFSGHISDEICRALRKKDYQVQLMQGKGIDRAAILDAAKKLQSTDRYDTALIVEK